MIYGRAGLYGGSVTELYLEGAWPESLETKIS
jgi:hypothetical protein